MKTPNLASWYHSGAWNFASDVQFAANGPRATTASTPRTARATATSSALTGRTSATSVTESAASRNGVSFITGDFRNVTSDCCASGGRYALAGLVRGRRRRRRDRAEPGAGARRTGRQDRHRDRQELLGSHRAHGTGDRPVAVDPLRGREGMGGGAARHAGVAPAAGAAASLRLAHLEGPRDGVLPPRARGLAQGRHGAGL